MKEMRLKTDTIVLQYIFDQFQYFSISDYALSVRAKR